MPGTKLGLVALALLAGGCESPTTGLGLPDTGIHPDGGGPDAGQSCSPSAAQSLSLWPSMPPGGQGTRVELSGPARVTHGRMLALDFESGEQIAIQGFPALTGFPQGDRVHAYVRIQSPWWSNVLVVLRVLPTASSLPDAIIAAAWSTEPNALTFPPDLSIRSLATGCVDAEMCGPKERDDLSVTYGPTTVVVPAHGTSSLGIYRVTNQGTHHYTAPLRCSDTPTSWQAGSIILDI